ncbi:hypothetical protein EJF36_11570 [Bacillus sp. HMF5848]|uniref:hypothetical protein n=1 Tax=Bacillus sp. HMF5848 TaxID=2495421 RepID=UPI000F7A04AA|nr:hypothetical protein [Bacillus sp. HMF5848]RSK27472.1 hypothetical protein EJF36_11570 [Bacillus sp. HMF5848]
MNEIRKTMYKGKLCFIVHEYSSGFCEVKEMSKSEFYFKVDLVHKSELQKPEQDEQKENLFV